VLRGAAWGLGHGLASVDTVSLWSGGAERQFFQDLFSAGLRAVLVLGAVGGEVLLLAGVYLLMIATRFHEPFLFVGFGWRGLVMLISISLELMAQVVACIDFLS